MSEPLSPAALAATAAAANAAPKAIRHFGLAAMEARAARSRAAVQPRPQPPRVADHPPPPHRVRIRLWLPLTPLFVLLSPLALVLALLGYLVPPRLRPDPILAAVGVGRLLLSLSGTVVDVQSSDAVIAIKIL